MAGPRRDLRPRGDRRSVLGVRRRAHAITGLDVGPDGSPDGSLCVASFAKHGRLACLGTGVTEGALYRVTSGVTTELAPGELTLWTDVAVAPDGTGYVTNQSVFSGGGQVVTVH